MLGGWIKQEKFSIFYGGKLTMGWYCHKCGCKLSKFCGMFCVKCHKRVLKELHKIWALPGGREKGQKDDPFNTQNFIYPHYLAADAIIRQLNAQLARRCVKNLNTIDADPDMFGMAEVTDG